MFHTNYDKDKKLWSNCDRPPVYNADVSVGQLFFQALSSHGTHIARINADTDNHMTYNELHLKTIRAAQNLQTRGYQTNQVFSLMTRHLENVAPIVFAAYYLGCPVNPLHWSFGKDEIVQIFRTTKPSVIFCEIENYLVLVESLRELKMNAKIFTFNGQTHDSESVTNLFLETGIEIHFTPPHVDAINHAVAIISDTENKNIYLTHAMFVDSLTSVGIIDPDDIVLSFGSFHWFTSLWALSLTALYGATRVITSEPFSPELQLKLIEKYKISFLLSNPYHLVLMLKSDRIHLADLSSIMKLFVTGSKPPSGLRAKIDQCLPNTYFSGMYSITEMGSPIAVEYPVCGDKDTSVGQLRRGCQVKIIDDNGNRCGIGVEGEICVKFDYKPLGLAAFDEEGFFQTGDIGYFDEDGDLQIVNRIKDLIHYCFRIVPPSSIEAFLLKSPSVEMACVVGIPDPKNTELPAAVIVRRSYSMISAEQIYDMVANHFPDYMKLRGGVYFIDSLPMTPSEKILRSKAKEIATKCYKERQASLSTS